MRDKNIFGRNLKIADGGGGGAPAAIHKSGGAEQAGGWGGGKIAEKICFRRKRRAKFFGERVNKPKSGVVAGIGVLRARISQTDGKQFHKKYYNAFCGGAGVLFLRIPAAAKTVAV